MLKTMAFIYMLLLAFTAQAQENSLNMLRCGSHPVFEFVDDMDGKFYYRKQVVDWRQGHSNAFREVTFTAKRSGNDCTLKMSMGNATKTYKYKVCASSARGARCAERLNEILDVTSKPAPMPNVAVKCMVGVGGQKIDYEDNLAKCIAPKSQTPPRTQNIPPACRDTSTGILIQPYTCTYATQPVFEDMSKYKGKVCGKSTVKGICSAKINCAWNNAIPRAGHVLNYSTYVFCPSVAGACRMSAMSCGLDSTLYFDDEEAVQESFRVKYNIPASAQ